MYRGFTAGLLTALVLGTTSGVQAADTYRLNIVSSGNTGSIQSGYNLADDDADTIDVYLRFGGYGGYRGYSNYGGYRGYSNYGGYGGYRNSYGYGGYGGYRNYGNYYGSYYPRYYGNYYGSYYPRYYSNYYYPRYYGYSSRWWGISDTGSDGGRDYGLILPAERAASTGIQSAYPQVSPQDLPYELPGLPEQPKSFRYDGGPSNPIPLPSGGKPSQAPADGKLVSGQPARLTYPAYGETPRPTTPPRDVLTGLKK